MNSISFPGGHFNPPFVDLFRRRIRGGLRRENDLEIVGSLDVGFLHDGHDEGARRLAGLHLGQIGLDLVKSRDGLRRLGLDQDVARLNLVLGLLRPSAR